MTPDFPKITLITPVLNAAETIEKTLQSVVAQKYPNLEYLIFDAGSTDGTVEIIKKYSENWDFIQRKDKGPADAYNFGIRAATGEIIGMLSADDWLEENILTTVGSVFKKSPELDAVTCCAQLVKKNKENNLEIENYFDFSYTDFDLKSILTMPLTNARFMKKKLFEQHGYFELFDKNGAQLIPADTELLLKMALNSVKNHRLNKLGYTFLKHDGSRTSSDNLDRNLLLYLQLLEVYEKFLANSNLTIPQKKIFKKYHGETAAHVFVRGMLMGRFRSMIISARSGMQTNPLLFFCYVVVSFLKLPRVIKKIFTRK